MELWNELYAVQIPLRMFQDSLQSYLLSLNNIQVNAVQVLEVVDHLGRLLSLPILFCSTWKVTSSVLSSCRAAYDCEHARNLTT